MKPTNEQLILMRMLVMHDGYELSRESGQVVFDESMAEWYFGEIIKSLTDDQFRELSFSDGVTKKAEAVNWQGGYQPIKRQGDQPGHKPPGNE